MDRFFMGPLCILINFAFIQAEISRALVINKLALDCVLDNQCLIYNYYNKLNSTCQLLFAETNALLQK